MFAKRAASVLFALSIMVYPVIAEAVNRFAVISIQNETAAPVSFNYRWGVRGLWRTSIVSPAQVLLFAYPFRRPDDDRSPPLFVRFNSAVQGSYVISHRLMGTSSPVNNDPAFAQWYVFRYDTNQTFIGLYTVPGRAYLAGGIFSGGLTIPPAGGVVTITP